jgi:hypothetical protein
MASALKDRLAKQASGEAQLSFDPTGRDEPRLAELPVHLIDPDPSQPRKHLTGTHHSIFVVGYVLQKLGFRILNDIAWEKPNPPPNLSCRFFTHSTETLIWAARSEDTDHIFNYDLNDLVHADYAQRGSGFGTFESITVLNSAHTNAESFRGGL